MWRNTKVIIGLILSVSKFTTIVFDRLERAKKLQEQREKEMVEKQKQQEIAAGNLLFLYGNMAFPSRKFEKFRKIMGRKSPMIFANQQCMVTFYLFCY